MKESEVGKVIFTEKEFVRITWQTFAAGFITASLIIGLCILIPFLIKSNKEQKEPSYIEMIEYEERNTRGDITRNTIP